MSNVDTKIEFNGLTLEPSNGYYITELEGIAGLPIRTSSDVLTDKDGANIWIQKYDARTIVVTGVVCGDNADDYFTKRRALINAFSITDTLDLKLTTWNNNTRVLQCRVIESPELVERPGFTNINQFVVVLQASQPFFCDEFPTIFTATTTGSAGGAVPFQVPFAIGSSTGGRVYINNTGDVISYPKVILNGSIANPVVTNVTNGTAFQINGTISDGDFLRVELKPNGPEVFLNDSVSYFANFVGVPICVSTGVNEIVYEGSGSGEMQITYSNKYLSA